MDIENQHFDNTYLTLLNLVDNTQTFAGILSLDGTLLFANVAPLKILGLEPSDVEGQKFWDCPWWKGNSEVQANIKKDYEAGVDGKVTNREIQFQTANGLHWSEYNTVPVLNNAGEVINLVVEGRSIDQRKLAEQEALASERKYKSLFEQTADALNISIGGKLIDCNEATLKMMGYSSKQEMLGLTPADVSPAVQPDGHDSFEEVAKLIASAIEKGSARFEWYLQRKSGEVFPVEVLVTNIQYGEEILQHSVWRDITEMKRQQKTLQHLAHYDSLTGLPNRILFADRFQQAAAHSKRTDTQLAVCFLDLDNFKPINDTFGHDVGDVLLIEVAQRVTASIREEDTVSRQGGDEFTLLLGGFNLYQECEQLIDRILHSLCEPYIIDGYVHSLTASCGITLYPTDDGDIDLLVRHADNAMYQAKLEGKNTFAFFNADTEHESQQHMAFLRRVSQAIDNNELLLHYQPKIDMRNGQMFGAEALIRWQHPDDGLIGPFGFLPKIENTQVMIEVGNWVIEQALLQLSKWCKVGKNWVISINIDANHFMQASFVEDLKLALKKHPDVPAKQLEIEILETIAFDNLEHVSATINACQALGVSFALDDFGTGYSSLAYLKSLPVQWLKIDQSFVRDILVDEQDLALIDGIVSLAKAFKREIIAEGVETVEHGSALLKLGCYNAQGYGIAKPMPAQELLPWQESYQADKSWTRYSKITLVENEL